MAQIGGANQRRGGTSPPAPEATAAANDEGQDSATGDIVVTARRTEENVQRVPSSVSAFNERALDRIQATDTTGLQGAVPNLNIVQGRGSSNATNIYHPRHRPARRAADLRPGGRRLCRRRLSVAHPRQPARPARPRAGRGAARPAGHALRQEHDRRRAQVRHAASRARSSAPTARSRSVNYDQFELKGAASGPVTDTLAAGFAVMRSRATAIVEDQCTTANITTRTPSAPRGALAFTPIEQLSASTSPPIIAHDDAELNVGRPLNNLATFSGGVAAGRPNASDRAATTWKGRTTPGLPNSTKLTHYGFAGTAALDVTDALTLKSITAYRKLKTDDYRRHRRHQYEIGDVFVGVDQNQFSQEFQLAYTRRRLNARRRPLLPQGGRSTRTRRPMPTILLGLLVPRTAFLRTVDDDLDDQELRGLRQRQLRDRARRAAFGGPPLHQGNEGLFPTTTTPSLDRSPVLDDLRVRAGQREMERLVADGERRLAGQSVDDGLCARRQGLQIGRLQRPRQHRLRESSTYEPETAWSYEAGFKTTIAGQLRLNGAVFHTDYKDFQARVGEADDEHRACRRRC